MNGSLGEDGDARPQARAVMPGADQVFDVSEHEEAEFWDACWTLEDEWQPHPVVRAGSRPHRKQTKPHVTEFIAFL